MLGGMDRFRVVTVRYLAEPRAIAVERVPRGEAPLLPESELKPWRALPDDGDSWVTGRIRELARAVNTSGLVRHDEAASYAGYDRERGVAYFVCAVKP